MGSICSSPAGKLFAAILYKEEGVKRDAFTLLEKKFGKIATCTPPVSFHWTEYYKKEMGGALLRQFVLFTSTVDVSRLSAAKLVTNSIEETFLDQKTLGRRINLDPGYITLDKAVLATTKNFSHRIHLEKGIFAELTYRYIAKTFTCLEWTYPEYRTEKTVTLFNNWRERYKKESTTGGSPASFLL